jgi:hypothetical protein
LSPSRSDVLSPWLLSGCGRAADGVRRGRGSGAGRSGDGRKGAGMNQWPCCFIDGGASPASHVSLADDCNSTARVAGHHGRIRCARRRSPYPFGDGGGASVRSANEGPRSSAAARVGMGSARRARFRPARCVGSERGSESRGDASPTRRRSGESHDALVPRGEGLWLHLDRGGGADLCASGRLPSRSGSGRPLPPPRGAADCDCAERQAVAIDVSMAPEVAHGRARRRSSNMRSVGP